MNNDTVYVGIDFSINSPGVTIFNNNTYNFISFTRILESETEKLKKLKKYQIHNLISNFVDIKYYIRSTPNNDYIKDQQNKLKESNMLADLIVNTIKEYVINKEIVINLEGFAFAAKGNSFIDLIFFNAVLRNKLFLNFYKNDNIFIITPAEVKKRFGKGNLKKEEMSKIFITNYFNDDNLKNHDFYKWTLNNETNIFQSPINDIIDSYILCYIAQKQ